MTIPTQRIADLERANYTAMLPSAKVTPGLDIHMRDDVILMSCPALPAHDSNHACLLRATAQTADDLIADVTRHFHEKGLPAAIYVSPACTPRDLPKLLRERGFREQTEEEAWLVAGDLPHFALPAPQPGIAVERITRREILTFAEVFMAAFEYPIDWAPFLAELLEPSMELTNTRHYLAFVDGQPVGTLSLLYHEGFGVLGSAGVLRAYREQGAATNMGVRAICDARESGVKTAMLQTKPDAWLERYLRHAGFHRMFTRSCFVLDYDLSS